MLVLASVKTTDVVCMLQTVNFDAFLVKVNTQYFRNQYQVNSFHAGSTFFSKIAEIQISLPDFDSVSKSAFK